MSTTAKILAFAGSARNDSFNKKLVKVAVVGAEGAGAEVTLIDLADYTAPLFDLDVEAESGVPESMRKLKALMKAHDGFLISSPEHNGSYSSLLKNTIDWCSRKEEGEKPLECYGGKVALVMSASPGGLGGLRGLNHLRSLLADLGMIVLPDQIAISAAFSAFDSDGSLADSKKHERVVSLGAKLAETLKKLVS